MSDFNYKNSTQGQVDDGTILSKVLKYELYHDFSLDADGNIPEISQTGQTFLDWDSASAGSSYYIENGALKHDMPTGANSASYLEAKLRKDVTLIGAEISFPEETPNGVLALCCFDKSLVLERREGRNIPNASIHCIVGRTYANITVYENGTSPTLFTFNYKEPLATNTKHKVTLLRRGDEQRLIAPFGIITIPVKDSRMVQYLSEYANFELFEANSTQYPAIIHSIWADSEELTDKQIDEWNIMQVIEDNITNNIVSADLATMTQGDGGNITLTSSHQNLLTKSVIVPKSKKLYATASLQLGFTTTGGAGVVIAGVQPNTLESKGFRCSVLTEKTVANKERVSLSGLIDLSDYTVGLSVDINVKALASAGTCVVNNTIANGSQIMLTLIPVI